MSVKFYFNEEIRRIKAPISYVEAEVLIRTLFTSIGDAHIKLSYKDGDDDEITVSSDLELKEALKGSKATKFNITTTKKTISQSSAAKIPPKVVTFPVPVTQKQPLTPSQPSLTLNQLCRKVVNLASDDTARQLAKKYGFDIMRVAWEDTARSKGSCYGPNITDMTLNVAGVNMPVIRVPNFSDTSWDVSMTKINCVVGNHDKCQQLRSCSLDNVLKQIWEVTDLPFGTNLYSSRDSHVLVQAQACFLPIAQGSDAKFNITVRNYQSTESDSACLILTVTSKGTSGTVCKGGVTTLNFNDAGDKRSFLGQRLKDDRQERGVALEGAMTGEEKQNNVIVVIQIPLKRKQVQRAVDEFMPVKCGMSSSSSCSFGSSLKMQKQADQKKEETCDVENVIVKLGEKEGAFESLRHKNLERDHSFPVRVTLQYYKGTSNPTVTDAVFSEIADQIRQAKKNADCWGSLVTEFSHRPTESKAPAQVTQNSCKCPGNHSMPLFATHNASFSCDVCQAGPFPAGTTLSGCRHCNFDVCLSCFYKHKQLTQVSSLNQDWTTTFL